jgi:hypothetical protein
MRKLPLVLVALALFTGCGAPDVGDAIGTVVLVDEDVRVVRGGGMEQGVSVGDTVVVPGDSSIQIDAWHAPVAFRITDDSQVSFSSHQQKDDDSIYRLALSKGNLRVRNRQVTVEPAIRITVPGSEIQARAADFLAQFRPNAAGAQATSGVTAVTTFDGFVQVRPNKRHPWVGPQSGARVVVKDGEFVGEPPVQYPDSETLQALQEATRPYMLTKPMMKRLRERMLRELSGESADEKAPTPVAMKSR